MRDDYYVTPLTAQQAEQLEAFRRNVTFFGFEVFCSGCGSPGFEPCEGCPEVPVKARRFTRWLNRGRASAA